MFIRYAVAITLALMTTPVWAENCNPTDVEQNMVACREICKTSHHEPECNGSGTMDNSSAYDDADGILRGFEVCHPETKGQDETKDKIAEQCLKDDRTNFIDMARRVYNHPRPVPMPIVKDTDFNVSMRAASDNKHIVIAEFDIPGNGSFRQITVKYHRDGKDVDKLNTYAIGAIFDNGKFYIKVTTYDYTVRDVSKHKYTVTGTVSILTPP